MSVSEVGNAMGNLSITRLHTYCSLDLARIGVSHHRSDEKKKLILFGVHLYLIVATKEGDLEIY